MMTELTPIALKNMIEKAEVMYRYFVVKGSPLLEAINRINDENEAFNQAIKQFAFDIDRVRFDHHGLVMAVFFGDNKPDDISSWREINGGGYFPRKNTVEGKKLAHELVSLPEYKDQSLALNELIDDLNGYWLSHKGRGYRVQLGYHYPKETNTAFVVIPVLDLPDYALEAYKLYKSVHIPVHSGIEMTLSFAPHESMTEVDKWEYHRQFESLKSCSKT